MPLFSHLTRRQLLALTAAASALPPIARASAPKPGGTLHCACAEASASGTLDPLKARSGIDFVRVHAHFNKLVRLADDLTPGPELAESFITNADATEWAFNLQKGVRFHDGSELTVDDVLWTFERIADVGSNTRAGERLSVVKNWKRQGKHGLIATLRQPDHDFPRIFGTPQFAILKKGEADFLKPVGTGPYNLKGIDGEGGSRHLRRDDYWRKPAHLDEIRLSVMPSAIERTEKLLAREIEMADDLPPLAVSRLQYAASIKLHKVASGRYFAIVCRQDRAPGNNRDFVLAMKYLQRRDLIDRTVLYAASELGNDHPVGTAYGSDHCEALSSRSFDRARAYHHASKSKIRKAELVYADVTPGTAQIVKRLQREADKIGVSIKLTEVPLASYQAARKKADMFVAQLPMQVSALEEIERHYLPSSPGNLSQWNEPRMTTLFEAARRASDVQERENALCQMQLLISNEAGVIIPVHSDTVSAHLDTVHGVSRNPLSSMGNGDWPENAWIEG